MPDMDGWQLARRLRETSHETAAILLVSAHPDDPAAHTGERRLHDAFLPKPIDLNALLETLGACLHLDWTDVAQTAPPGPDDRIPACLMPHIDELDRLIGIGHVSALRMRLDDLAIAHPADAVFIDQLRRAAEAFRLDDLASMIRAVRRENVTDA
jgi:CheY-like chemotaxis protein